MSSIKTHLEDIHKQALHKNDTLITNVSLHENSDPDVERQWCTCIILSQALEQNNLLIGDYNIIILSMIFEELAAIPSNIIVKRWCNTGVAVTEEGRVVTWGNSQFGGDSSGVAEDLNSRVMDVIATNYAFAALIDGGKVVSWGHTRYGGDISEVADELRGGVVKVVATADTFAALTEGGKVVSWGWGAEQGDMDSTEVARELDSGVVKIVSTKDTFVALKEGGRVVSWGNLWSNRDRRDMSEAPERGVVDVESVSYKWFSALKDDGKVVEWGKVVELENSDDDDLLYLDEFFEE